MKKLLLVQLLSLFSVCYADNFNFIGYRDSCPVFFNNTKHEIVIKKNDTLRIIKKINTGIKAIFVKNELIVLESNENGNYFAHLIKGEREKKIPITGDLTFITGNENMIFHSDFSTSEIYMLSFEGSKKMNLKGLVVGFDENCLYYSKENNAEIISANVEIYKVEIGDFNLKSELVASNLAGEKTIILPKGRKIVDEKLHKGKFRLCIIETISEKIVFLDLPKENKHFGFYHSLEKNTLDFYNNETLEIYSILLAD
jgi:hypothetical protein